MFAQDLLLSNTPIQDIWGEDLVKVGSYFNAHPSMDEVEDNNYAEFNDYVEKERSAYTEVLTTEPLEYCKEIISTPSQIFYKGYTLDMDTRSIMLPSFPSHQLSLPYQQETVRSLVANLRTYAPDAVIVKTESTINAYSNKDWSNWQEYHVKWEGYTHGVTFLAWENHDLKFLEDKLPPAQRGPFLERDGCLVYLKYKGEEKDYTSYVTVYLDEAGWVKYVDLPDPIFRKLESLPDDLTLINVSTSQALLLYSSLRDEHPVKGLLDRWQMYQTQRKIYRSFTFRPDNLRNSLHHLFVRLNRVHNPPSVSLSDDGIVTIGEYCLSLLEALAWWALVNNRSLITSETPKGISAQELCKYLSSESDKDSRTPFVVENGTSTALSEYGQVARVSLSNGQWYWSVLGSTQPPNNLPNWENEQAWLSKWQDVVSYESNQLSEQDCKEAMSHLGELYINPYQCRIKMDPKDYELCILEEDDAYRLEAKTVDTDTTVVLGWVKTSGELPSCIVDWKRCRFLTQFGREVYYYTGYIWYPESIDSSKISTMKRQIL